MRKILLMILLVVFCGVASAQTKVEQLAVAIARTEGFYAGKHTIPARLHNPGDIRSHSQHAYPGQRGLYRGYVVFASDRDGWQALRSQLYKVVDGSSRHYDLDMTFKQFARTYAEDPQWGRTVCKILAIPTTMTLAEWFDTAPRILLTGDDDASTLRLLFGGEHQMPELRSMPTLPTFLL